MKAALQDELNKLKTKVENLVNAHQSAQKEIKTLRADKKKLESALAKSMNALEAEKNKALTASTVANSKDKAKMIRQINQYIKLIDTSIAQAKEKV